MHGKGRSTQRWDPGLLDTATGILGWGRTSVGQGLFLTWNGPSFLGGAGKSLGGASRPGWLSQHPSAVLWGCSELTDSGCRGRVPQWGALGWEQWQQGPAGASFRWVGWDFKEDRRVSIPSSVGTDNWDWGRSTCEHPRNSELFWEGISLHRTSNRSGAWCIEPMHHHHHRPFVASL